MAERMVVIVATIKIIESRSEDGTIRPAVQLKNIVSMDGQLTTEPDSLVKITVEKVKTKESEERKPTEVSPGGKHGEYVAM